MLFFFFNDTATTEIYTLSLHDALPISVMNAVVVRQELGRALEPLGSSRDVARGNVRHSQIEGDRKSTRLNSSHGYISYAVFCLKKKNTSTRCNPDQQNASTNGIEPVRM